MAELYDLIFYGINPESPNPAEVKTHLARLLKMEATQFEELLRKGGGTPIARAITQDIAQSYKSKIQSVGGVCNYRPAQQSARKLELAPIEADQEEFIFRCPACNYRQQEDGPEHLPIACPQCGVIPSKYDKVSALKLEQERVRRRLLAVHQAREKQDQEEVARKAAKLREQQIEEAIRKELGIPKGLNTRAKLMSSVGLLWLLGVGMGAGGMSLVQPILSPQQPDPSLSMGLPGTSEVASRMSGNTEPASPQQESLEQVFALSQGDKAAPQPSAEMIAGRPSGALQAATLDAVNEPFTEATTVNALVAESGQTPEGTSPPKGLMSALAKSATDPGGPEAEAGQRGQLDPQALWRDIEGERTWDLFLSLRSRELIRLAQPQQAERLAEFINDPSSKIASLARLAQYYQETNNLSERDRLTQRMSLYANQLQVLEERTEAVGVASLGLWRLGNAAQARRQLDTLEPLVLGLTAPDQKARCLIRLAFYQIQIGQQRQAEANFRKVNALIALFPDQALQVRTYARLARAYAQSGKRAIAMTILSELLGSLNQIPDEAVRNPLLLDLAMEMARIGEAESALNAIDKLPPETREGGRFSVTEELAHGDRPYDAMKGLAKLESPVHEARAAGLMAYLQRLHQDTARLSSTTQERALLAQDQIVQPMDQALVRAELARYLAYAGQARAAEAWGQKAFASIASLPASPERETVLGVVAVNLSRADQPKLATESLKRVKNPDILKRADQQVANGIQVFKEK